MYPHERSLVKQLANHPFAIVGVNCDPNLDAVRELVKEKNLTWSSFQDESDDGPAISENWKINGMGTVFIIDATGKIRAVDPGIKTDKVITDLLAEMGHAVKLEDQKDDHAH